MENTSREKIEGLVASQRKFFRSGATLDLKFRKKNLRKLSDAITKWEKPLSDALYADLHKSYKEAYMTEISIVLGEIKNHIRHLSCWASAKHKYSPLKMFPSRSKIVSEPLGQSLIIAPWNYPVQLLLNPLVGAISSGCTAILKPSPYVENVSRVVEKMIQETFDESYIAVVQGNREVNTILLEQRYDIIFFTGSPSLGKLVMGAAAKNLTPVVLELGGKSPCIVDKEANIDIAARRIAWGKTLNAGQTCIAPDYLLLHEDIKDRFVEAFNRELHKLHGDDLEQSEHYVRMVSDRAFDRVVSYMQEGTVVSGGHFNRDTRYIEPTLIENVKEGAKVLEEEIFGPVFPIITFTSLDEVLTYVNNREKPLAFYFFGSSKDAKRMIRHTSSGGACINDTIMHIVNENIPFGGVGNSGLGHYHGEESFTAFSHQRSVVTTPAWLDLPFRYMPYSLFKLVKMIL